MLCSLFVDRYTSTVALGTLSSTYSASAQIIQDLFEGFYSDVKSAFEESKEGASYKTPENPDADSDVHKGSTKGRSLLRLVKVILMASELVVACSDASMFLAVGGFFFWCSLWQSLLWVGCPL